MRNISKLLLVSAFGAAISLGVYTTFFEQPKIEQIIQTNPSFSRPAGLIEDQMDSFTLAAEKSVNSVVHVTTAVEANVYQPQSPLDFFFGTPRSSVPRMQMGSGSGVIVSKDGYIVTNNHVIERASTIKVTLNNQQVFDATVVGTDPTTDIALIKINAENKELPYLVFSNSDEVRLGEWVLAVGNPFNLTSTVTAGIVSAKSRNIGVINRQTAIESFIQTDAAVNPGNSGGALVNLKGNLIGINSAISTHTGSFEGYSFAVPSNIVQKVVRDILEFGTVQRAFIGVNISDITPKLAEQLEIKLSNGVYVGGVSENGAAEKAGIKTGDIIIAVDDRTVTKSSELQEIIGRKRPGDKVVVKVDRNGDEKFFRVELRNQEGTTAMVDHASQKTFAHRLGAELSPASENDKSRLGISYGVKAENISAGILKDLRIPNDFIITHINKKEIRSINDINSAVEGLTERDPVVIQGYTAEGKLKYYAFGY